MKRNILRLKAFLLGMREFRTMFTFSFSESTYDEDFAYELDRCYDWGREWAHRLTLRRYDS